MPKEKKTIGFEVSADAEKDIRKKLDTLDGVTNADKLMSALTVAAAVKARNEMGEEYRDHIGAIEASLENIRTSATSIVNAAAEERKRELEELHMQLVSREKTIRDLQRTNEELEIKLDAALKAQSDAEMTAAKAQSEAACALEDKAFFQHAARDKDELIAFLREKLQRWKNTHSQLRR